MEENEISNTLMQMMNDSNKNSRIALEKAMSANREMESLKMIHFICLGALGINILCILIILGILF